MTTDTIAAVATPPGRGGIGIVRVSGPGVREIARMLIGNVPAVRHAVVREFHAADATVIDRGLALFFEAPASFTGEDVLELHGHGGPIVMDMLMECVCALGARPARPGEFSERAFLNERVDLAQAEAVADLIDAGTREAAQAAMRSMDGEFSRQVLGLAEAISELRVHVEAAIDFPEEEIDFLGDPELARRVQEVASRL